ncbi:MAG: hypothetical protein C0616_13570 [Desulfuromonas sp.]|nr:MAG: hypothetical protein C0616_13570 [Desulfuromonas sp.]
MIEPSKPSGIKFYSWEPGNGYGDAAKAYMMGLVRLGIPVTWTPLVLGIRWAEKGLGYQPFEGTTYADTELEPLCNRSIPYDIVIAHISPEYFPAIVENEPGKRVLGYTVWETDKVPAHWPPLLNSVQRLLVPCKWNREVFRSCGVHRPIDVVPHILPELPHSLPTTPQLDIPGLEKDDFLFYTIGTWTSRKALWKTVEAFLQAFSAEDRVTLVIKTTQLDFTHPQKMLELSRHLIIIALHLIRKKHWVLQLNKIFDRFRTKTVDSLAKLIGSRKNGPKILLCDEEWDREKIEQLHHHGDCFVSLCHSEGWGLGAFEAAGLGRPVIITGFGGHLDFLPPELSYLVDYRMAHINDPTGGKSYTPDQQWADPNVKHAASLLRLVFENREQARDKGEALGHHVRSNFNETTVIKRLLEALQGGKE